MSLHPGETGVCPKHGVYDEYCGDCADEKRRAPTSLGDKYREKLATKYVPYFFPHPPAIERLQELIDAATALLAWQPICSLGSSGDLRQKRLRKALENLHA